MRVSFASEEELHRALRVEQAHGALHCVLQLHAGSQGAAPHAGHVGRDRREAEVRGEHERRADPRHRRIPLGSDHGFAHRSEQELEIVPRARPHEKGMERNVTRDEFNRYIVDIQERWPLPFWIARSFRTAEEWDRWSSLEFRARASNHREVQLNNVLYHRHTVVLGEAGSGKSVVARKAIELAAQQGLIPIFLPLAGYSGDLPTLIRQHSSDEVLQATSIEITPTPRLYIFDGYDEVAADRFNDLVREINALVQGEPDSRILLTSRQAFFVGRQAQFAQPFEVFYVLDFSDDDVDAVIRNAGVDRAAFRNAANLSHLSQELGNPLALDALLKRFQDCGDLGQTRSDALQHVVDSALESRPTSNPRAKRALRMLATAMEVAARNQLTDEESVAVLRRALRIDAAAARTLLDELAQSVLVRTPDGYGFQLHSYGEYLAAEELSEIQETDRILRLMYLDNTLRLSDSWRNCVSYLMERHRGIRSIFSRRFPDWTLTASPAVFDEQERTTIVRELLDSLIRDNVYLLHHPTIRVVHLARFVPEAMFPQLRAAVESTNDVEAANAALLLAAYGDKTMADRLLALALDPTRNAYVRNSALAAYDQIGTPASVPRLLDIQDWDERTVLSRIDAAAGLMDSTNMPLVLAALGRTDAMISSAFDRFHELNDRADLEAVLDALVALPADALQRNQLSYYLDRFWRSLARSWRPEWVDKVAELVLGFENVGKPNDDDLQRDFVPAMQSLSDHGYTIGRRVVERMLATGRDVNHLYHTIPALVGPDGARWLVAQPASERLVGIVRAFGPPETRDVLRGPITAEQQEQLDQWQREEQQRQERTQRVDRTIATSEDGDVLLPALARVDPARWPELTADRRDWLATFVDEQLGKLDLRTRIRWRSETELTQPRILPLLLALVKRYELRVANDEPMAVALLAETDPTRTYHQRFGLSDRAVAVIEGLLEAVDTPNPGLDQILRFIRDVGLKTPRIIAAIERIAMDAARPTRIRDSAVRIMADARDAEALLRVAPTLPSDLGREADDFLVEAQHRGTIERRLGHLLDDPAALASGDVDIHFNNPLEWVGRIREPAVWDTLVRLRRLALQREIDRVASLLTNTLAQIDMMRAARVIDRQIGDAPALWQPALRRQALEMTRDATIRVAQGVAFEGVLRRLENATTLNRFKIWVEGPTDCPSVEDLAHKVLSAENLNIVVQSLGGWGTIRSRQWTPLNLGDGCHDFAVLLDGDGAYDYTKPGLIEQPDARAFLARLRQDGIEVKVLDRYGLENYFPRHAFEAVMGRDLSAHFPLDHRRPVRAQIRGYNKNMNVCLAKRTTLDDLAGTDLEDFLKRVGQLA